MHCSLITITAPPNNGQPLYSGRCYKKFGGHYFTERTGTEQFRRIRLSQFTSVLPFCRDYELKRCLYKFPKLHFTSAYFRNCWNPQRVRAPPEKKLSTLPPCRPKALHLQLCQQPCPQRFVTLYILPHNYKHLSRCALITDCLKSRHWGFCPIAEQTAVA